MTVITFKNRIMAADSLTTFTGTAMPGRKKIVRLPDNSLLGCSGDTRAIRPFVRWCMGGKIGDIGKIIDSIEFDAL